MDLITAAMIIPGGALLGVILLSFLQYHLKKNSLPYINARHLKSFTQKYASDRLLHRYLRRVGIATPVYLVALLSILAINAVVLAISKSKAVLIARSGRAVLVNLILLLVCGRPNIFSERLHVSQQFKNFIHRWLGMVAITECVVHIVFALSPIRSGMRPFTSTSSIAGLTATISIAFLGVLSLPFVRRYAYEIFLSTHIALTIIVIVALFFHLTPLKISQHSLILLITAGSTCAVLIAIRTGISIWNRAQIRVVGEGTLLKVEISLAKPRQVRAGQYIFLRVPSTSAHYESHPFFIASWEQGEGNKTRNITVLIQRQRGFTRLLQSQPTPVNAFLEGPYGSSPMAEDYSNVILFASEIGIAAQLGCIKQLLDARDQGPTRTQTISLLWEVDEFEPWDAAIKMVHKLLDQDADRCDRETPGWENARSRFIFQYTLFVRNHGLDLPKQSSESTRGRQCWKFGALSINSTLSQELTNLTVRGPHLTRTLISVCANQEMTEMIQSSYTDMLLEEQVGREDVVLHTFGFNPNT